MTKIPGSLVFRDTICDECRDLHGDDGAVNRMVQCVADALKAAMLYWPRGEEHRLHVVVTHEKEDND